MADKTNVHYEVVIMEADHDENKDRVWWGTLDLGQCSKDEAKARAALIYNMFCGQGKHPAVPTALNYEFNVELKRVARVDHIELINFTRYI